MTFLLQLSRKRTLLSIVFCFLLGGPVYSQQLAHETETVGKFIRVYNYLTDDLGYFVQLQGEQECFDDYGMFSIKCDKGKPVSFSFHSDKFPVSADNMKDPKNFVKLSSRGLYNDQNGLCVLSSYCENADMKRALSAYRLGNIIDFVGKLTVDKDRIVQYGWIDIAEHKEHIISFDNSKHSQRKAIYVERKGRGGVETAFEYDPSNSILCNKMRFVFEDKDLMEEFLACRNAEEVYFKYYLGKIETGSTFTENILIECPWAPGFTRWNQYSGFTDCKKHDSFPNKYFYYPVGKGKDDELHYLGLNYDFRSTEGVSSFWVKRTLIQKDQKRQIKYLTNEQYVKYKDKIEYDRKEHRHGVKAADGSYLYVPEEIEAGLIKTASEESMDRQDSLDREERFRPYRFAYDAIRETNKVLDKMEFNLDYVFNSDSKETFYEAVEKFENNYARSPYADRLLVDDFSYLLKDADTSNDETINVMAAFLSAKENNFERALQYVAKVDDFTPIKASLSDLSGDEWLFSWNGKVLCSSNSCPRVDNKYNPDILLLCCVLLDKVGKCQVAFNFCKKQSLIKSVDQYLDHLITCPGIVMYAISEGEPKVLSNQTVWISLLESMLKKDLYENLKNKSMLRSIWEKGFYGTNKKLDSTVSSMIDYSDGFFEMNTGGLQSAIEKFKSSRFGDYKERIKKCEAILKEKGY